MNNKITLSREETELIDNFRKLNGSGRANIFGRVDDLTTLHKYTAPDEELEREAQALRDRIDDIRRIIDKGITRKGRTSCEDSAVYDFTCLTIKALREMAGSDTFELILTCLEYGFCCGYNHAKKDYGEAEKAESEGVA